MGLGGFIDDIGRKEDRLESFSDSLKSKLSGGADDVELLDEEKRFEDAVLDLEKETVKLLSKEVDNRRKLFESNKEFIQWYNSCVKELSSLVEPYNGLRRGLTRVVDELESVEGVDGEVPLQVLDWESFVLEPASTIGEIVKDMEARRSSVIEDLGEAETELVLDKDFAKTQKTEIEKLNDLVSELEDEQTAISRVINKNNREIRKKFELEKRELEEIENNLKKIQKLEAEFEHYEEEIKRQKQELTLLDISKVLKNKKSIEGGDKKIEKRVAELFNLIESPRGVEESLEFLEREAENGRFIQGNEAVQQIESIEEVISKTEKYVKLFGEASEYVNLGEIISNRKKELAEWTAEGAKNQGNAMMSRRGFMKAAGAVGFLGSLDTLNNVKNLKSHGQDTFMSPGKINSANDEMIAQILDGDKGKIFVFDIYFENQVDLDPESSKEFIYNSLSGLEGVNVEIEWIPIQATVEGYCERNNTSREELRSEGSLENIENIISDFRTVVKEYGVTEEIPEELSYYGVGSEESSHLHETLFSHILSMTRPSDNLFTELNRTETTVLFLGDFQVDGASGVSTYDSRGTGKFALAKRYDNSSLALNIAAHELGHKLRLPHSYSQDVMSYSLISQFAQRKVRVPFGPESRLNWRKVRRNFEDF